MSGSEPIERLRVELGERATTSWSARGLIDRAGARDRCR